MNSTKLDRLFFVVTSAEGKLSTPKKRRNEGVGVGSRAHKRKTRMGIGGTHHTHPMKRRE